jgi:hypothetical protein
VIVHSGLGSIIFIGRTSPEAGYSRLAATGTEAEIATKEKFGEGFALKPSKQA